MTTTKYNSGRIADIISYLRQAHQVAAVHELPTQAKLITLCEVLQLTPDQLDALIVEHSEVLRTVKGHVFEIVFQHLVIKSGYEYHAAGGDTNIDGMVNGKTLQLKTPYKAGTRGEIVSYKSHKTHGAKSEAESMEYYARTDDFPDYMVGLITYSPLRIVFIARDELPTHAKDPTRILSPFSITWAKHPGLNAFARIGMKTIDPLLVEAILPTDNAELLPRTAKTLQLKTDFILDTILLESNFRIWDMNMRGFARENYLDSYLKSHHLARFKPALLRPHRGDKADFALQRIDDQQHVFFQMKGVSINECHFHGNLSVVGVETQLTRGRVNDHPTQSRLYLATDFDYLIIALDPAVAEMYNLEIGKSATLNWEFYMVPVDRLIRHTKYSSRLKSIQKFLYVDLQQYRLPSDWTALWVTE